MSYPLSASVNVFILSVLPLISNKIQTHAQITKTEKKTLTQTADGHYHNHARNVRFAMASTQGPDPNGGDTELEATCVAMLHHICLIAHSLVDGELRPVFTTERGSVCKCVWQKGQGIVRI